jgi:hypothetical protein
MMTRGEESSAATGCVLVAFELSQRWWKAGFTGKNQLATATSPPASAVHRPIGNGLQRPPSPLPR